MCLCLEELLLKPSNDAIVAGSDSKLSSGAVATVTAPALWEMVFVKGSIFPIERGICCILILCAQAGLGVGPVNMTSLTI